MKKKSTVIIAAAGSGKRMGSGMPKQYLRIDGEPILLKTVKAFHSNENVDGIFVVAGKGYEDYCRKMFERAGIRVTVVTGGAERQDSIFAALQEVKKSGISGDDTVLIHDGARPYVTGRIIDDVVRAAENFGASAACVPVKDSIRRKEGNVERKGLYQVQTPQGFRFDIVYDAYEKAYRDGYMGTDDASLVERCGREIEIVQGDYGNIKITTKEDMPLEIRCGNGFDVHAFAEGRKLILGGVDIPYEKGLDGHSDADVLVHAAMDALLGAAAMGDIGRHFPDSDEKYKGISSLKLLAEVDEIIKREGYEILNLDITLIAQRPKIAPHVGAMTSNIAEVLGINEKQINIKGTTTEGLGFTGRGEGIACQASCTLKYKGEH